MSTGLDFRHSDGTPYGSRVDPRTATTYEQAFRGLRSLGFRETEARTALERIRRTAALDADVETVLRMSIMDLTRDPTNH